MLTSSVLIRSSQDTSDDGRSNDSQRSSARRTCQTNGWTYGEEYEDVKSASEYGAAKGVVRKDFERLKKDIAAGRAGQVLIVASVSRTARDIAVLEGLRKLLVRAEMKWCIGGRVLNPAEAGDTTLILIEGVLAQTFSQNQSKDVRRGVLEARAAGRAPAGRTPFGYYRPPRDVGQRVVQLPHTVNADLVRWAARAVPEGATLGAVGRRWQAEGEPHREWERGNVRKALLNPAIIGMTTHKGGLSPGDWPALVTAEEYTKVQEALARPERRAVNHQQSTSLLARVARHEGCGGLIRVKRSGTTEPRYSCVQNGGVWLFVAPTDALVTRALFEEMYFVAARARARAEDREATDPTARYQEDYAHALSEYEDLRDNWHAHGLKLAEFAASVKPLRRAVDMAKERLAAVPKKGRDPMVIDPRLYPAYWSKMTLDEQRQEIRKYVTVTLTREGPIVTPRGV
jgi:DNA invertase Pin-like site-specific DNA recombinase